MNIAYITNTTLKESSGGGSGVNMATYNFLKSNIDYISYHVICPKIDLVSKIKSVLSKKLGLKRTYHFFSEKRLVEVSRSFEQYKELQDVEAYFFHGFTQWIKTKPNKPYFCFNDACFATYVEIYNNKHEFSKKDLKRIYAQEALWLSNATKVFFRSQWALDQTKEAYNLDGLNFLNVGVGGFIDVPDKDEYKDGFNFLFVSREFIPKGGLVVVEAIKLLRKKYSDVNLWIVGDDPGETIKKQEGISYLGFFKKNEIAEKAALIKIFESAFALIHPTLKDTNTLVINELAYFGCPAIASNRFAIPEYLINGKSGYLLNNPRDKKELVHKMSKLIEDKKHYIKIRQFARENALANNTWGKVGERIIENIIS